MQETDLQLLKLLRVCADQPERLRACLESGSWSTDPPHDPNVSLSSRDLMVQAEADAGWLLHPENHLILWTDSDFPLLLREVHNPPAFLFARGNRACLNAEMPIAIVGSRKCTEYGRQLAFQMSETLAQSGCTVVSGLALGVDGAAHEGALAAAGQTIAVLGTGCDQLYPRRHWRLAERIIEQGLLISEFPLGTPAYPGNFPRRNRIVTGFCLATVVVEAALRSGSLISARLALAEGRDVMAIPGRVSNPQAKGCHQLIQDGAALVDSAAAVLSELGLEIGANRGSADMPDLTASQRRLLAYCQESPQSVDALVARLQQNVDEITIDIVTLEVMGLLFSEGGRYSATAVNMA